MINMSGFALEAGDIEKCWKFLKNVNLSANDNPLEATALEHGFIPENDGLATVELDWRIMSSLHSIYGFQASIGYR